MDLEEAANLEHARRAAALRAEPSIQVTFGSGDDDIIIVQRFWLFVRKGVEASPDPIFQDLKADFAPVRDAAGSGHATLIAFLNANDYELWEATNPVPTLDTVSIVRELIRAAAAAGDNSEPLIVELVPCFTAAGWDSGPAGPPRNVAVPGPAVLTQAGSANQVVAVLDTGFPADMSTIQMSEAGASDIDPVYTVAGIPDLDEVNHAGHGRFVASVIAARASLVHKIEVYRVAAPSGVFDSMAIITDIARVGHWVVAGECAGKDLVVVMPFGGYMHPFMTGFFVKSAITTLLADKPGTVVCVAAANKGSAKRTYPAAWAETEEAIISVGALDGDTVAPFSNHGSWVKAWADGMWIRGSFVAGDWQTFGPPPVIPPVTFTAPDPEAEWCGTSFATPIVAAAILREAALRQLTPLAAWRAMRPLCPPHPFCTHRSYTEPGGPAESALHLEVGWIVT